MPSFTGNLIAIKGSRSGEESNILTLQNNNVPSMAVMVSGGLLTDGSIDRLQEFVDTSIKGDLNYSKFLILEGESNHDALSGASSMKIEIKPLTNEQHTDALWDTYDAKYYLVLFYYSKNTFLPLIQEQVQDKRYLWPVYLSVIVFLILLNFDVD